MERTIDDKLIEEIRKAVDELVAKIPAETRKAYFDIKGFAECTISVYLTDPELPERYFIGFLNKVKRATPEKLLELEELRLEYGASFYLWPTFYKKIRAAREAKKKRISGNEKNCS